MLKTVFFCSLPLLGVWYLWRRRRKARERARRAAEQAPPEAFHRLTRAAMVYANWPDVTVMHHVAYWPEDPVLVRTTADPYHRRAYVETLRLVAGRVLHAVCLYVDGSEAPAEAGCIEVIAEQTNVYVLRTRIEDIVRFGTFISLRDPAGRTRELRVPKEAKHHA